MPLALILMEAMSVNVLTVSQEMVSIARVSSFLDSLWSCNTNPLSDIDECADANQNNCSEDNAICTDTIGSYDCTCSVGYTGNGFVCNGR